jgi:DNA-binding cell septation regulator SpoVG
MRVHVSSISGPSIAAAIGSASIDLHFDNQTTLHIADLRIFRNQQGQLWVGWPMRRVQDKLTQIVSASRSVHRGVEDAVLAEFERHQAEQKSSVSQTGATGSSDSSDASVAGGAR